MAVQVLESNFPSDRMPLLRWLMFTGVCTFGAVLLWYFGLFRLMLASDKTYISLIILCLYIATSIHCFIRTTAISREMDAAHRVAAIRLRISRVAMSVGRAFEPDCRARKPALLPLPAEP